MFYMLSFYSLLGVSYLTAGSSAVDKAFCLSLLLSASTKWHDKEFKCITCHPGWSESPLSAAT